MLESHTNEFIEAQYLPPRMKLKDPRNMTKSQLLAVIDHINARDDKHGTEDAFRFSKWYDGTKMMPAENSTADKQINVDEVQAAVRVEKARAVSKARTQKAKSRKEKQSLKPAADLKRANVILMTG